MDRRDFLVSAGAAALLAGMPAAIAHAKPGAPAPAWPDIDPIGGYTLRKPKAYLFADQRLINPGDLIWRAPDDKVLPVAGPPEPMVPAHADWGQIPYGIKFALQRPSITDPLDQKKAQFGRVIFDGDVYRSWTLKVNYPPGQDLGAYSKAAPISVSIIQWESRDLFEWTQAGQDEIKVPGQARFDGFTFFIDPHGPERERFKAVYTARPPEDQIAALLDAYAKVPPAQRDVRIRRDYMYCMYGMTSPDGKKWKPIEKPLFTHAGDTDTTVYFDEFLGKYVMYTRLYWLNRRMIARVESDDFIHWKPFAPMVWPGLEEPQSTDIYTNSRTIYPGMPEVHLMFPMFYHRFDQTSDIRMFTSFDGITWNQVPGGPLISPEQPGLWDCEYMTAWKDLVPMATDRVALTLHGTPYPHKYPRWKPVLDAARRGWAWWPKGRLVALEAPEEGGFTTFPVPVMGRELRLNARTRKAGGIQVGLVNTEGRAIVDCEIITGDSLAHPVRWRGSTEVGVEQSKEVALQFKMRAAELFGFEWI